MKENDNVNEDSITCMADANRQNSTGITNIVKLKNEQQKQTEKKRTLMKVMQFLYFNNINLILLK